MQIRIKDFEIANLRKLSGEKWKSEQSDKSYNAAPKVPTAYVSQRQQPSSAIPKVVPRGWQKYFDNFDVRESKRQLDRDRRIYQELYGLTLQVKGGK